MASAFARTSRVSVLSGSAVMYHGGIEPHGEGAADNVRDGAGEMGERGAAVGAARVSADGADRQLQIGIALLHQIDLRDGKVGRAEGRAGFDLAAALV